MRLSYESLLQGHLDAAELLGPYSRQGRESPSLRLLYDTAIEWHGLTGTWPMKHVLASFTDVLDRVPELSQQLAEIFFASTEYGRENLAALAAEFSRTYGGNADELANTINPKKVGENYTWSLTKEDILTIQAVIDLSVEYGFIGRKHTAADLILHN